MAGPEDVSFSPEIPSEEKVAAFGQASVELFGFMEVGAEPEADQWRPGVSEEERTEAAKNYLRGLLGLRKEGEWSSAEEALEGIDEPDRETHQRIVGFLKSQGITEEILKEEQEGPQSSQEAEQPATPQTTQSPGEQEGGQSEEGEREEQTEETEEAKSERITIRRPRRRGGRRTPEEEAVLEADIFIPEEERREGRATDYYERMRQRAVRGLREVAAFDDDNLEDLLEAEERRGPEDIGLEQPVKTTRLEDISEKDKRSERRRQQYLALTAAEAIKSGSYIERQKLTFLVTDNDLNSSEASILKAAEFVQKCQAAATGTTKVEQTEQTIGDPGPEVFSGLRMLTVRVEVKTKDGKEYSGDISPLHMMDLMDNPRWCHKLMTNRFDAGGTEDPGYFDLRKELMDELLCQQLKDSKGNNLPEDAKITWSNLYSFALKRRIDKKVEQEKKVISVRPINEREEEVVYEITGKEREDIRGLVLGDLWWLHDAAWYIFSVGGRQRAWDKALEGRWQLPQMRKPLLPASYEGIKYNTGLWFTRRFFRVINWHDFWSEQAKYIVPAFLAEKDGRKIKRKGKEWDIINRKMMRRGALPHIEEEESKIALGFGEYQGREWSRKATEWLNNRGNITRKGEMKAFSEMQNVVWTDEEREAIQDVDFRPALERMRQFDPEVKIEGNTKGVEGYQKVVSQLSYQNLDYSAVEQKAWLSQMSYTTAANNSHAGLDQLFKTASRSSSWGTWPSQSRTGGSTYWDSLVESVKGKAKEAANQLTPAIGYVSPAEKNEIALEIVWALAQGFTNLQRDWIGRVKITDEGQWEEDYVREGDTDFPEENRREALERLGYQFIKISDNREKVFGPSGAPVRRLVECPNPKQSYYCPALDQKGGRPLGWRLIGSVANALKDIDFMDQPSRDKTMDEIKKRSRRQDDQFPGRLPGDRGIGSDASGPPEFRPRENYKIIEY